MKTSEAGEPGRIDGVAILAAAGRFPGAAGVEDLWRALTEGRETIRIFTDEELAAAGVDPALLRDPAYVKAMPALDGIDRFDAAFFGYSPGEAELLDPQQRLFLEHAWEALESAGYDPARCAGSIGVFAGSFVSTYMLQNLLPDPGLLREVGEMTVRHANDKDYVATRVSYKLGLHGPSFTVSCACSTSLVAVHLACQSLLNGECDLALAGGVSVSVPQIRGYLYEEGGILSPDGHCRALDERSQGTVFGNGVGVVVLKRLEDALADGDPVWAVVRGSAVSNDGAARVSFQAPGVTGETRAVAEALAVSGVDPASISYVELHGTGTSLGDSIEIEALKEAFRSRPAEGSACALGSVKTNVGHLGTAAGVTGLIKTALMLRHRTLVPTLHFQRPHPQLGLEATPFRVATELRPWEADGPLRAGVSSFGIGGTNAHIVLEEAPPAEPSGPSRPWQLLLLSARTPTALEAATDRLAAFLREHPDVPLADAAHTLQVGRREFGHRRTVLCRDGADAAAALERRDPERVLSRAGDLRSRSLAFLLPGLGDQYPGMARGLYQGEPTFRKHFDRCARLLEPHLGLDLRELLFPAGPAEGAEPGRGPDLARMLRRSGPDPAAAELARASVAHPAVFAIEHALARLLREWGLRPDALLGYSVGEYTAACLAGAFSLEDALALVAQRARLLEDLPPGALLAVPLAEAEIRARLWGELGIAAVNGPALCVIAGPEAEIDELERLLAAEGVVGQRLQARHAFHSRAMEAAFDRCADLVRQARVRAPEIPWVSNLTGRWITAAEATDPLYWARHLCGTVRFADGLTTLWEEEPGRVLLEVGPGRALTTFALQAAPPEGAALATTRAAWEPGDDQAVLLRALGRLWLEGVAVDWAGFFRHERRRRVPLPTYPFERQVFWREPRTRAAGPSVAAPAVSGGTGRRSDPADWFYLPVWRPAPLPEPEESAPVAPGPHLLFVDPQGLGDGLARRLAERGERVITAMAGDRFVEHGDGRFTLAPGDPEGYRRLLAALPEPPATVTHLWSLGAAGLNSALDLGFYSLLAFARSVAAAEWPPLDLWVVTDGARAVTDLEEVSPEKATALGPARVIPQEIAGITCRSLDLALPAPGGWQWERLATRVLAEIDAAAAVREVALRGDGRWVRDLAPLRVGPASPSPGAAHPRLRDEGVYLLIGGLGEIGVRLATHLAKRVRNPRLALLGRSPAPPRETWEAGRFRGLREAEAQGAELLLLAADAADPAALRAALDQVRARWGALHGVIHLAGITGAAAYHPILDGGRREYEPHFQAKARSLQALEEALGDGAGLDLCLLLSSVATVIGGLGTVAYTAANHFVDAFAHRAGRRSRAPWISLASETWKLGKHGAGITEVGLSPEEGLEVLDRALALGAYSHLIVSDRPLAARLDAAHPVNAGPARAAAPTLEPPRRHPRPHLPTPYMAPADDVERRLAALWEELLGVEGIGVHDNFLDLGGHSLLASRLIGRLNVEMGVRLPVPDLFAAPTVARLAERLRQAGQATGAEGGGPLLAPLPPVTPEPRDRPVPLSFAQERIWIDEQIRPGTAANNVPTAWRFTGPLRVDALMAGCAAAAGRHEILRTVFAVADGRPVQVARPEGDLPLPVVDLSGLGSAAAERARELLHEEARRPFDLSRGPLLRALLVRLGPEEHLLGLTAHHAILDNLSYAILLREVGAIYRARVAGVRPRLPELPVQYADWVVWQRRCLEGETLEAQVAWWKRQLAGAPPLLQLPADRPRPPVQSRRGHRLFFRLPDPLVARMGALCKAEGATPFMALLAALVTVLYRWSGQDDLLVGTPVAGRSQPEVDHLVGLFINTLVLRTRIDPEISFRGLLERVRATALDAFAHAEVPFERLVEELAERSPAHAPLFQVLFVLNPAPGAGADLPGLEVSTVEVQSGATLWDLVLVLAETGDGGYAGSLLFNTDLFESTTAAALLAHFERALAAAVEQPDLPLPDIPLTDEEPGAPVPVVSSSLDDALRAGEFLFT